MAGERVLDGLRMYRKRYKKADKAGRSRLLDEFCKQTGYHRKYAIAVLRKPADTLAPSSTPRRRGPTYSAATVRVLAQIWKAAGYPWSERLKAMLPQWLPWAHAHIRGLTPEVEAQLRKMSPPQMARRLQNKKRRLKGRIYGRTKPGTQHLFGRVAATAPAFRQGQRPGEIAMNPGQQPRVRFQHP